MARDLQVVDLSRVKNVCKKKKLREFHLKLLHRIVGTKKYISFYCIGSDMLFLIMPRTWLNKPHFFKLPRTE